MKKSTHATIVFIVLIALVSKSNGDARAEIIKTQCTKTVGDEDLYTKNYIHALEIIGAQIQTSHSVTTAVGTGPNKNYVMAECYGDLSSLDCVLCYAQMRTSFPGCYPGSGGRIYLDGCFLRLQNYSFFEEIQAQMILLFVGIRQERVSCFKSQQVGQWSMLYQVR
ncbi:putative non-specific serine/threonine protein kinase [Helianthus anomalus]